MNLGDSMNSPVTRLTRLGFRAHPTGTVDINKYGNYESLHRAIIKDCLLAALVPGACCLLAIRCAAVAGSVSRLLVFLSAGE